MTRVCGVDIDHQPFELRGAQLMVSDLGKATSGPFQVLHDATGIPVVTLPLFRTYEAARQVVEAVTAPDRKRPPMRSVLDRCSSSSGVPSAVGSCSMVGPGPRRPLRSPWSA